MAYERAVRHAGSRASGARNSIIELIESIARLPYNAKSTGRNRVCSGEVFNWRAAMRQLNDVEQVHRGVWI